MGRAAATSGWQGVLGTAAIAVALLLPVGGAASLALLLVIAAVLGIAVLRGAWLSRAPTRAFWWLFAGFIACQAAWACVVGGYMLVAGVPDTTGPPAVRLSGLILTVVAYLALAGAATVMLRHARRSAGTLLWVDTGLVVSGAMALMIVLVTDPIITGQSGQPRYLTLALILSVIDLYAAAVLARVVVQQRGRNAAALWALGAASASLAVDIGVSLLAAPSGVVTVRVTQAALLVMLLGMLAVRSADASAVLHVPRPDLRSRSSWRIAGLGVALAVPFTLFAYSVLDGWSTLLPALMALCAASLVLALMRVRLMLHGAEREADQAIMIAADQAAARERRRMTLDLHDGLQQHLVAMRQGLGVMDHLMAHGSPVPAEAVERLIEQSEIAMSDLRQIIAERHPPALRSKGLVPALRGAMARLPIDVQVMDRGLSAVVMDGAASEALYFSCLEGVQNAMKHGRAGDVVLVELGVRDGDAYFVIDSGERCADGEQAIEVPPPWSMRERLELLGGRVEAWQVDDRLAVRGYAPLQVSR